MSSSRCPTWLRGWRRQAEPQSEVALPCARSLVAGCTDSSSSSGRTRPSGIEAKVRRYTGRRCICPARSLRRCGRIARDASGRGWRVRILRETGRSGLRLDFSARAEAKAGVAELAGCLSARDGTTRMGRVGPWQCPTGSPARFYPCHPVSAIRGKRIAVWPKEPNGALKGATYRLPNEAACSAPSDIPMAANGHGAREGSIPRAASAA